MIYYCYRPTKDEEEDEKDDLKEEIHEDVDEKTPLQVQEYEPEDKPSETDTEIESQTKVIVDNANAWMEVCPSVTQQDNYESTILIDQNPMWRIIIICWEMSKLL